MINSQHQAEDKLIILYVLEKIKTGLTEEQISLIIIENLQMSYFDIKLYLDDLVRDDFVRVYPLEEEHKEVIAITNTGKETLNLFKQQIPSYICEMLDLYITQNRDRIFKEVRITGNFRENTDGDYQVELKLHENNIVLMELNINTPSRKQALIICDNWKEDTQSMYASILKVLTKQ